MSSLQPPDQPPVAHSLKPHNRRRIASLQKYSRIELTNPQTSALTPTGLGLINQADILHKTEWNKSLDDEIGRLRAAVERLEKEVKDLKSSGAAAKRKLPPKPESEEDYNNNNNNDNSNHRAKDLYEKYVLLRELYEREIPAYKKLCDEIGDYIPDGKSPLNTLLAIGETIETIRGLSQSFHVLDRKVESTKSQLPAEDSQLSDNMIISSSLKSRISILQSQLSEQEAIENDDKAIAKNIIVQLKTKQKEYDRATSRFLRSLMQFVETRLAIMVFAEDLGGPVVGDDLGLSAEELLGARGFSKAGKLLPVKKKENTEGRKSGKQRTIEEMFRKQKRPREAASDNDESGSGDDHEEEDTDPISLTARNLIDLIEKLLNASFAPSTTPYVQVEDCAAVRFLVRARVANMHHSDARRIRLVEWAKEIED